MSWATAGRATYAEAKAGRLNPDLAIDVSNDEIRVIDLNTNALLTSAPLTEAKATPATRMGGFYERRYAPKGSPVLVACVPGAQRLTIGWSNLHRSCCPETVGFSRGSGAFRMKRTLRTSSRAQVGSHSSRNSG